MSTQGLFSWTVVTRDEDARHLGACGVCNDRQRALRLLEEALHAAPAGSVGLVHKVTVRLTRLGYLYDGLVARGELDPSTGQVTWLELSCQRGAWGAVDALLKVLAAALGDSLPPEAVAVGLEDLTPVQDRRGGRPQ